MSSSFQMADFEREKNDYPRILGTQRTASTGTHLKTLVHGKGDRDIYSTGAVDQTDQRTDLCIPHGSGNAQQERGQHAQTDTVCREK